MNGYAPFLAALLALLAGLAVGKAWAGIATVILCGSMAGAFCLYGVVDMTGLVPLVSRDLGDEARFGFDAGVIQSARDLLRIAVQVGSVE